MPKRADANQPEIVKALREAGCSVQHLHTIGKGTPDILVGRDGMNVLLEIKRGNAGLTPDEEKWHRDWKGQVATVRSPEEALRAVGKYRETEYPEPKPLYEYEV